MAKGGRGHRSGCSSLHGEVVEVGLAGDGASLALELVDDQTNDGDEPEDVGID